MTKNKYNIHAIRNELDSCIRYNTWSKFRSIFDALTTSLKGAVAKGQPIRKRRNKTNSSSAPTLLCALCRCINKPSIGLGRQSHPPIDLFHSVILAHPSALLSNHPLTPLAIAIDRQAAPAVIETLLQYHHSTRIINHRQESLLYTKGKGVDTPILAVVRQRRYETNAEEIIRLLLKHDTTRQSLLIPSETKKKRVPLYFVAKEEVPFLSDTDELLMDQALEYMLLETFRALEIRDGRMKVQEESLEATKISQIDFRGFFSISATTGYNNNVELLEHIVLLLQATIACAHLLGSKNKVKLLVHLINRIKYYNPTDPIQIQKKQKHYDTLLRYACQAKESDAFLESCPAFTTTTTTTKRKKSSNLLQYLIAESSCDSLALPDKHGDLPIHLAIRSKKCWDFLKYLCTIPFVFQIKTKEEQLALHLAIGQYPANSKEIFNVWDHYPEAAITLDGKHRLFAFGLASLYESNNDIAETAENNSRAKCKQPKRGKEGDSKANDINCLELTYFFLRAFPQVLQQSSEGEREDRLISNAL